MIYENINIKGEYFNLSSALIENLKKAALLHVNKLVIGICGESGSGKSVTGMCLQIELEKLNIKTEILHQDSYFMLPPKDNHAKRKADITWVGSKEVNLNLLQVHIERFKANQKKITIPVVDYENNMFLEHEINIEDKDVLIVEGVYAFLLDCLDYKIFIERTYKDTLEQRKGRSREEYDPFVEQVLGIEHSIVNALSGMADVVVGKDYSLNSVE